MAGKKKVEKKKKTSKSEAPAQTKKGEEASSVSSKSSKVSWFSRKKKEKKNGDAKSKAFEKEEKSKKQKEAAALKELEAIEQEESNKVLEKESKNKFKLALAFMESNPQQAMTYLEESRDAEETMHGEISSGVAIVCEKIGDIFYSLNKFNEAVQNYERTLTIHHILETGENYTSFEERSNMIEVKERCKARVMDINSKYLEPSSTFIPTEITLNGGKESNEKSRARKPLARQAMSLLPSMGYSSAGSVSSSTIGGSTYAASVISGQYSILTPGSMPKPRRKIHPKEEESSGDRAEDAGELKKAVDHYNNALHVWLRKREPHHRNVLRIQIKIADTLLREGAIFSAVKIYGSIGEYIESKRKEGIFFLRTMVPSSKVRKRVVSEFLKEIEAIEKKGDNAFRDGLESGNFMSAANYYNRALKALYKDKTLKPGNKHVLRIHVKLGNIKWMMDDTGNIYKAYEKPVQYLERKGDTMFERNNTSDAVYCYAQTLRFLFKLVKPEHEHILKIQVKIADIYFAEQESLSALSLYKDALSLVSKNNAELYRKLFDQTFQTHEDVGESCVIEKDPKSALYHYKEALGLISGIKWDENEKNKRKDQEATLLEKIGDVNMSLKNFESAEECFEKANHIRRVEIVATGGNEDKQASASNALTYYKIGSVFEGQNEIEKAKVNYQKAVDMRRELYGQVDGELAKYMFSLSMIKKQSDDVEGAFEDLTKLLVIFESVEPDRSLTSIEHVNALKELALMHEQRQNKILAFRSYARQLTKLQFCRSTTLMDIANVLKKMGRILFNLDEVAKALKYFEMELNIMLGVKNVEVHLIADTYISIGDCHAALNKHSEALENYQKGLYDDAPASDNLIIYNKIGIQLAKMEKFEEALRFHQTSILYLHDSDDFQIVKMAYNNLANAYHEILNYEKAFEYYKMSPNPKLKEGAIVPNYTLYNLGNLFQQKGLKDKAKKCFEDYIEISKDMDSTKEILALKAHSLNNIGNIFLDEGDFNVSTDRYRDALILKKQVFGSYSKEVYGTLCNLGSVMYRLRDAKLAEKYFLMALAISTKVNSTSLNQARVLHKLGNVGYMVKDYQKALDYYKRSYTLKSKALKDDTHEEIMFTRYSIGLLFLKFTEYGKALELFEDLYEKRVNELGPNNIKSAKILLDIAKAQIGLGYLDEAKILCLDAIEVFEKNGSDEAQSYLRKSGKLLTHGINKFIGRSILPFI